jgi:hypothetical protein
MTANPKAKRTTLRFINNSSNYIDRKRKRLTSYSGVRGDRRAKY